MPEVTPSQVVQLIEAMFPHALTPENQAAALQHMHLIRLAGIIKMIEDIPSQLIIMPVDNYAEFVQALTIVDHSMKVLVGRGGAFGIEGVNNKNIAFVLHEAMKLCPDEFPPESDDALSFIADEGKRNLIKSDVGAANQAFVNREWKAATILAGSAVEALLYWKLSEREDAEVAAAAEKALAKGMLKQKAPTDWRLKWTLPHLIAVSRELDIISSDTYESLALAKDYRNLIHPSTSERVKTECNRGTSLISLGALENVIVNLAG